MPDYGEPLVVFRNSGEPAPGTSTPAASPETLLPVSQTAAKQQLDAIYGDRDHPYHKGDMAAAEQVLELTRRSLGDAGRQIVAQWGMPPPSAAAAADTPSSRGAVKEPSDPAPVEAEPQSEHDPDVAAFRGLAQELEMPQEHQDQWLAWEARQPKGDYVSLGRELGGLDVSLRAEAEADIQAGLERLSLGLRGRLERKGLLYHPTVLCGLVTLGQELRDLDEEIAMEQEKNPASTRLRELYVKRRGHVARQSIQW